MASRVELGAGIGVGCVQGNDLVADEVVSGLEAGGDGVIEAGVTGIDDGVLQVVSIGTYSNHLNSKVMAWTYRSPVVSGALAAGLLDLEPDGLIAGQPVLAAGIRAAGHVGQDGAHVGVRPLRPPEGDSRSGLGGGMQRRGRAARVAAIGVAVALEVDERDVLDGAVARHGTRDALRLGVHVRVGVGVVELVVLTADGAVLDEAVGSREGGAGQEGNQMTHVVLFEA